MRHSPTASSTPHEHIVVLAGLWLPQLVMASDASQPALAHWALDALILLFAAFLILRYRRRVRELAAVQKELRDRDQRLQLALTATSDGYWEWDLRAETVLRSALDGEQGRVVERHIPAARIRERVYTEDIGKFEAALNHHLAGRARQLDVELRMRTREGGLRWVHLRGAVVERDAEGHPCRLAGTFRDISEVRRAQRASRIAEEVIQSMQEAVAVSNATQEFVTVNPAFERMTGFQVAEILGQPSALLNSDRHDPDFYRRIRIELEAHGQWSGELWQRRKNGEEMLVAQRTSRIQLTPDGERLFVAVLSDITEKRRAEHRLERLANHDPLTGVANRNAFLQQLDQLLLGIDAQDGGLAVIEIDLDRLKHVNETHGHEVGDELLQAVALRLEACLSPGDLLARLGSDEFIVAAPSARSPQAMVWYAQFLISAFAEPFRLRQHEITVTPSIGISRWPEHGADARSLINAADSAMYEAKADGRNTFRFFSPARHEAVRRRTELERRIRQAVDHNEFIVVYQPRFSVLAGRITGFEALLRWRHPDRGLVGPDEFVPVLEETGLIVPVGRWVLSEALSQVREWHQRGHAHMSVSVNVSHRQLREGTLQQFIVILLNELGLRGDVLELEITESQLMDDPEAAIAQLDDLHRIGVRIAIDDFGTGYSSLAHLRKLPIDILKIDRAFVSDVPADSDSGVIIETILGMARTLKLRAVAEGVENEAQARFLSNLGVDELQGFWVSRPIPAEQCLATIETRSPRQSGLRSIGGGQGS